MASKRILLVEPKTRTSYPPLGLMKLATYHKLKGDSVSYVRGTVRTVADEFWDAIYITSVFTYDFNTIIKTIQYYMRNTANVNNIKVGGVSATLLAKQIEEITSIKPHKGLLNSSNSFLEKRAESDCELLYLSRCTPSIDNLPPDYDILVSDEHYKKIINDAYFFYCTKGCPNSCKFCAVGFLEPKYVPYIPILPRIQYIAKHFGERQNLLLLDNNIAASESYDRVIDEIRDCGFERGATIESTNNNRTIRKQRTVDFNQGVDLRFMNKQKMSKMAEIAITPLRLAFDNISLEKKYEEKMQLAVDCGIHSLSNYMLFNFNDHPVDLYRRFQVNMRLLKKNEGVKIFSFPMRYSPIERTDRTFVGKNWTKREIRALQLILHATHGIVSHKERFFNRAFGCDEDQFQRLLLYPYHYILNRNIFEYERRLIEKWEKDYARLTQSEAVEFKNIISFGRVEEVPVTSNSKINRILAHYEGEHASILPKSNASTLNKK